MSPAIADAAIEVLPLLAIVLFAFVAEASLGFGSTLITVTLGASLVPLHDLLPAFVPLNLAASIWILGRNTRVVDTALLTRTILPWLALGLPAGLLAFLHLDAAPLARILGVLVAVLAARELLARNPSPLPPHPLAARAMLVAGGLAHGAFGSGGPFVVYVAGRMRLDKEAFRATLAVLWIVLSLLLLAVYFADGRLTPAALARSAAMAAAAAAGLVVGDRLFRRIPPERFRILVFSLLLVAGLALLVR